MKLSNVLMAIGVGPENTITVGIISDGYFLCSLSMSREQCQHHIDTLQRHVDLLPSIEEHKKESSSFYQKLN